MAMHAKTLRIIDEARALLAERNPMTVRQVYYRLVSGQVIKNTRSQYQAVSNALVTARKEGTIPWNWIEDRLRRPRTVSMWQNLDKIAEAALATYRRDVWVSQSNYVEFWLEKDALSGIFETILRPYGVTLNVGRGYDGWDSIHNAADRFGDGGEVSVLYFGDLDPSGEDMVRSLRDRLGFFGCHPEIVKCALTIEGVEHYGLPPDFTKTTDSRRAKFVSQFGDIAVELDALPVQALEEQIRQEVETRIDLGAMKDIRAIEHKDKERLMRALGEVRS